MSESRLKKRDYAMTGEDGRLAVETGLAAAEWYHTSIPRTEMKAFMRRTDGPAIRDTILWLGSMAVLAGAAIWLWPTWWSVPFILAYGVLYGSAADSRWHECGHGTAFRTRWMNDVVYQIACFMMIRNPVRHRWTHARHHTDTIIVGRDPEIITMRPPDLFRVFLMFFGIDAFFRGMKGMFVNAAGVVNKEDQTFIPESDWGQMYTVARVWLVIYAATIALAVWTTSFLPIILIGLPRIYGAWHFALCTVLQHAGLAEDVHDHRLNTRTVLMNPISRFIYWNMNYHVEHHMFPMVPYHALPMLHERLKHDFPKANTSIVDAYRQVWPILMRQCRYEDVFLTRNLPDGASPYRSEFHDGMLANASSAAE